MKGIIFTEFLEMVEEKFGPEVTELIIEESNLESGGAYTTVGTYSHMELLTMISKLSDKSGLDVEALVKAFAGHFFEMALERYAHMLSGATDSFDILEKVESYIHVEVKKLYPDAELPTFKSQRPDEKTLILEYTSERAMFTFAEGLMEEVMKHFKEDYTIDREMLDEEGSHVRFTIKR